MVYVGIALCCLKAEEEWAGAEGGLLPDAFEGAGVIFSEGGEADEIHEVFRDKVNVASAVLENGCETLVDNVVGGDNLRCLNGGQGRHVGDVCLGDGGEGMRLWEG